MLTILEVLTKVHQTGGTIKLQPFGQPDTPAATATVEAVTDQMATFAWLDRNGTRQVKTLNLSQLIGFP